MKRITLIFAMISLMFAKAYSQAPMPVEGWPYITRCIDFGIWMMPRFGIDGNQMHIFFNAKTGEVDKFELNGAFSFGWPVLFDSVVFETTSIILDIDHDNKNEMLIQGWGSLQGRNQYLLYLFDDNGAVMSGFPQGFGYFTYSVADFDGDNEYEITGYDYDNRILFSIDRFGNPKPGWPISFDLPRHPNAITGGPAVGDLDLDGKNEYLLSTERYIYAFKYDGSVLDGFPIQLQADTVYYYDDAGFGISLADVDNDGFLEIITNAGDFNPPNFNTIFFIYKHDGTIKEGWPKFLEGKYIFSSIVPADINGDGQIDLVYQSDSLTAVDIDLNPLPGWPISPVSPEGVHGSIFSDPVVLDIDGDGDMEIFFDHNVFYPDSMGHDSTWYYGHSYQFGVDHLGQSLTGFPMRIKGMSAGHPPTMGLEPNSSHIYLSVASMFFLPTIEVDTLFVELFRFPDSTGEPNQWPMISHDNLMTRNYNFVDNVTSIANDTPPPLPKSVVLKQNYPNPFNAQTTISYSLPKASLVTIDIYDLLGRKLETLVDTRQSAGRYSIIWDATERSSGIYFCRIKAGDVAISRKMVLMK